VNVDQFTNARELQKEMLAKKMETIDYSPFGKGGGGGVPNSYHNNLSEP